MKTAEEWYLREDMLHNLKWRPVTVMSLIKTIQLDAYKAGMTEAAEIAWNGGALAHNGCKSAIQKQILTARDNKTNS